LAVLSYITDTNLMQYSSRYLASRPKWSIYCVCSHIS